MPFYESYSQVREATFIFNNNNNLESTQVFTFSLCLDVTVSRTMSSLLERKRFAFYFSKSPELIFRHLFGFPVFEIIWNGCLHKC